MLQSIGKQFFENIKQDIKILYKISKYDKLMQVEKHIYENFHDTHFSCMEFFINFLCMEVSASSCHRIIKKSTISNVRTTAINFIIQIVPQIVINGNKNLGGAFSAFNFGCFLLFSIVFLIINKNI